MALDESCHARKLAQALRDGDQAEQRRSADWKAPQGVDPAPADPNARRNASLRGHPVVHKQAIVRIAEAPTERIGRAQRRVGERGRIAFGHRQPPSLELAAKLPKRRPVMEGNMVGLSALDLILRNVRAGMMGTPLTSMARVWTRMIVPLTRPASEFQLTRSPTLKLSVMMRRLDAEKSADRRQASSKTSHRSHVWN